MTTLVARRASPSSRRAADDAGYGLVSNARIDVFLAELGKRPQAELVDDALERARAYVDAGVDCVYPIALAERDAITAFVERSPGPVNLTAFAMAPQHMHFFAFCRKLTPRRPAD